MFYKIMEVDEIFSKEKLSHEIVDIIENNGVHLKLVFLQKNVGFDSHISHTNVFIYLIEGEIEITFEESTICGCNICQTQKIDKSESKQFKIKKGQMFLFEKEQTHTLKAIKDSKFILVKM